MSIKGNGLQLKLDGTLVSNHLKLTPSARSRNVEETTCFEHTKVQREGGIIDNGSVKISLKYDATDHAAMQAAFEDGEEHVLEIIYSGIDNSQWLKGFFSGENPGDLESKTVAWNWEYEFQVNENEFSATNPFEEEEGP